MKRRSVKKPGFVRVTVSIPRKLWPFFEVQRKRPTYGGNRSALVRDLIIQKMKRVKAKAA